MSKIMKAYKTDFNDLIFLCNERVLYEEAKN